MHINQKISLKKKRINCLFVIISMFFLILFINLNLINNSNLTIYDSKNPNEDHNDSFQNIKTSNSESILFQGTEAHLNITDTGNFYEYNQEISVSNQGETNLTYYLDDVHDWKGSTIETTITNIQDTRNWINNSGFKSPIIYRVYQVFQTDHNYSNNNNLNWASPESSVFESGAKYIRVHFVNFSFELSYDFLYLANETNDIYYVNDSKAYDLFSPWIPGEYIKIDYDSDNSVDDYGYYIDYYEYINDSSNTVINSEWSFNYNQIGTTGRNYNGVSEIDNSTAMYVAMYAEYLDYNQFSYEDGAFSEVYQDFSIPRGTVSDAYISFDYYAQYGLATNDNYVYVSINNKKIYSKGIADLLELGKNQWHKTGKITTNFWVNSSSIFDSNVQNQQFNISIGIKCAGGYTYTNFDDGFLNIIWFDNVSLVLSTIGNSSQDDINLKINSENLFEGNEWGFSNLNFTGIWETNPVTLSINTTSPDLNFILNTTIYGNHSGTSKINQQNDEGISYKILNNGSIYWDFFHNFYMPSQYSDFEFNIQKPKNWKFLDSLDPTLQSRSYEGGDIGDSFLKINKTNAIFPGWWSFRAESPNYLNILNSKILKESQWVTNASFNTGESTRIKTQLNYSGEIPNDAGVINLTIYHPNGTIFYEESVAPFGGNVSFSEITFGVYNTSGGLYEYTLFWSNSTALGGLISSFIVMHQSSITLLKPDNAISDLITDAFFGDIIPLRIQLKDLENNRSLSGAMVTYNWSTGLENFAEAALGIYETILDTSELNSNGFYEIFINSSKLGFTNYNITVKINLLEETNLLRLESSYYIELHDNSTVKYSYTNFSGGGISSAIVDINLNNSY